MRHRKKGRKLSRTSAHRKATRQNLAKALLEHERIVTTPAKAKEAKPLVEKLITLARKAQPYKNSENHDERAKYVHYYRLALKKLQDKTLVQKLFGEGRWHEGGSLGERYADRPSGQTRILRIGGSRLGIPFGYSMEDISELNYELDGKERKLKLTGNRLGDNAPQVLWELVREDEGGPEEEEDIAPEIDVSDETAGERDAGQPSDAESGADHMADGAAAEADTAGDETTGTFEDGGSSVSASKPQSQPVSSETTSDQADKEPAGESEDDKKTGEQ